MARKYLMTWEGSPAYRWVKMYHGQRYRISCDDLKTPRTKEESYQRANGWWSSQLAKLMVPTIAPERLEAVNDIARKIDYAANYQPELVPTLEAVKREILAEPPGEIILDDASTIARNIQTARLMGVVVPPDLDPTILQHLFGDRRLWTERLSRVQKTEKNKTIGYQVERFLEEQRHHQSPSTHKDLANHLRRLMTTPVWAKETSVETIDEATVSRHYTWLMEQHLVSANHNKNLGFFRRFVQWLWESGLLADLPRNLKRKDHRKKRVYQEIRQFSGVKETLSSLPHPYRLWALLAVNCGMTPCDLGATMWEQIDIAHWTLTRRRVKRKNDPHSPTVRYKLFPETAAELKKLPHRKGLLFKTTNGKPMYETRYRENGNAARKDMFGKKWRQLKVEIPLGKFRSIGASALNTDKLYRQYVELYLAHAPQGITAQHYAAESDEPFFEALEYLRKTVLG